MTNNQFALTGSRKTLRSYCPFSKTAILTAEKIYVHMFKLSFFRIVNFTLSQEQIYMLQS